MPGSNTVPRRMTVAYLRSILAALLVFAATPALAQTTYPTPAGSRVNAVVSLSCDANGANCAPAPGGASAPSASALSGVAPAATPVAAASLVAKASPGNLYGYNVTSAASAGYVMIFNSTTVPADGTVTPAMCLPLAANTGADMSYTTPEYYSAGVTFVFSTTGCFTKTASATAFISANVK